MVTFVKAATELIVALEAFMELAQHLYPLFSRGAPWRKVPGRSQR